MTGRSLIPTRELSFAAASTPPPPSAPKGAPLLDIFPHSNSFDFLRIAAAAMVLVSHMFSVAGREEPGVAPAFTLGGIGLAILFSVSGFMITRSWQSDPHLLRFAMRRLLRIFPMLIFVVLLCTLGLGPIAGTLSAGDYYHNSGTWDYLWNILLQPRYTLPGVFGPPHPVSVVNGSFWTFGTGALLYLSVAILGLMTVMRRPVPVTLVAIGFAAGSIAYKRLSDPVTLAYTDLQHVLDLSAYFWGGAALYCWRRHINFTLPRAILVYSLCAILVMTPYLVTFTVFAIPYLCYAFGSWRDPWFRIGKRLGNLSYGIYLFAYPVEQLVWEACHETMPLDQMIIVAAAVSACLAWVSWHVVEYPMLRLKPAARLPRTS